MRGGPAVLIRHSKAADSHPDAAVNRPRGEHQAGVGIAQRNWALRQLRSASTVWESMAMDRRPRFVSGWRTRPRGRRPLAAAGRPRAGRKSRRSWRAWSVAAAAWDQGVDRSAWDRLIGAAWAPPLEGRAVVVVVELLAAAAGAGGQGCGAVVRAPRRLRRQAVHRGRSPDRRTGPFRCPRHRR
jgi:hypothetical protein